MQKGMSRRQVIGGMGAFLAIGGMNISLQAKGVSKDMKFSTSRTSGETMFYGHRGALMYAPENTLPALELCLMTGCGFEIDFRELRDGEIIALHDGSLNRTTDTRIPHDQASSHDLDYIKELDAGSWFHPDFTGVRIPTLPEVCDLIRRRSKCHGMVMLMDTKIISKNFLTRIRDEFEKGMSLFDKALFRVDTVAMAKTIHDFDSRFICVKSGNGAKLVDEVLNEPLFDGVWTGSQSRLDEIHRVGKSIYMTLFNQPEHALSLKAKHVSGVITNYPQELKRIAYPPPSERDWNHYMKSDKEKEYYCFSGKI